MGEILRYRVKDGEAESYLAEVPGADAVGQLILVHEVWGFTPFIRESCDRLSRQGFRAFAPLLYWRHKEAFREENVRKGLKAVWGLSLEERRDPQKLEAAIRKGRASDQAATMLRTLYDPDFRVRMLQDLVYLAKSLRKERPQLPVAALGFSMGGKLAMQLAARLRGLSACVAVSAEPLTGPDLGRIRSPLLLIYGSDDRFMLRNLTAFIGEAVDRGKELALKIYPSAGHEFFDPTDKAEYREEAARDAWETSVHFMRKAAAARGARAS